RDWSSDVCSSDLIVGKAKVAANSGVATLFSSLSRCGWLSLSPDASLAHRTQGSVYQRVVIVRGTRHPRGSGPRHPRRAFATGHRGQGPLLAFRPLLRGFVQGLQGFLALPQFRETLRVFVEHLPDHRRDLVKVLMLGAQALILPADPVPPGDFILDHGHLLDERRHDLLAEDLPEVRLALLDQRHEAFLEQSVPLPFDQGPGRPHGFLPELLIQLLIAHLRSGRSGSVLALRLLLRLTRHVRRRHNTLRYR